MNYHIFGIDSSFECDFKQCSFTSAVTLMVNGLRGIRKTVGSVDKIATRIPASSNILAICILPSAVLSLCGLLFEFSAELPFSPMLPHLNAQIASLIK
ncbi:hypothetical protein T02_3025 [Trichinella nativa]|uniref:Uncharacterized protein n=1 Tax=Trichinella nativa TaxID=6335 RepID=A0A0V1KS43_9BILA|nr:hypothetical protein T02_3025 [Trichinella nativa]